MRWLLIYELVDDYLDRRVELRAEHSRLPERRTLEASCSWRARSPTRTTERCSCSRENTQTRPKRSPTPTLM